MLGGLSDRVCYNRVECNVRKRRGGDKAHTTVENTAKVSVSMMTRTTKRTAVNVPYITQGYMGTPNNLA